MLRSAQPSQFSKYPSQYIDTPGLAVLQTFSHLFSLTRSLSGFKLLSIVESDGKIGDVGTGPE